MSYYIFVSYVWPKFEDYKIGAIDYSQLTKYGVHF